MARFMELTKPGGQKVTVNLDNVCTFERVDSKTTTIKFVGDQHVHVEETPARIMAG